MKNKYLKDYLEKNPGSVFVLGSIVLLFMSMFIMYLEDFSLSNSIATYGFYLIVIGVMLQLTSVVGEKMGLKVEIKFDLVKEYLIRTPGATLVCCFIVLFFIGMLFLLNGNTNPMNYIANYGFYLLICGVLIQLLLTFRKTEENTYE